MLHFSGDITSRLTSDCQTMSDTVANNVNVFLRSLIMFVGSLIVMVQLSWQMTTMVFIALPIIAVVSKVYGKYYEVYCTPKFQACLWYIQ